MARFLVIDDDNAYREMIVAVLQHDGHGVAQAATGQDGLTLFQHVPADVVITDIVMPNANLEGMIALRTEHPGVPFIVMSGLAATSPLRLGIAELLHPEQMLEKPFKLADLLRAIDAVLARLPARPAGDKS